MATRGRRTSRTAARSTALAIAFVLGGCLPTAIRPTLTASPPTGPSATIRADLCAQLAQVFEERNAVGDGFRLLIAGKVDEAGAAAGSIDARLDALLADLPAEAGLAEPQASLRGVVEASAHLVKAAADVINDQGRPVPDAQLMLVEGQTLLGAIDTTFSLHEPGDTVSTACPGLAFTADPVRFPPGPSAAALGLPDRAGRFSFEPHLARINGWASDVLQRLGGDPDLGREIDVDVTVGDGGHLKIEVYEGVEVHPAAFADAAASSIVPGVKPVKREVAGFTVIAFVDRDDPSVSVHVASRGDRILVLNGFSDVDVEAVLAAMP